MSTGRDIKQANSQVNEDLQRKKDLMVFFFLDTAEFVCASTVKLCMFDVHVSNFEFVQEVLWSKNSDEKRVCC